MPFEEFECRAENATLEVGLVARAEGSAQCEGNPEETRQLHLEGMLAHEADAGRGQALGFEIVTGRADRAGTVGSDGDKADGIDRILSEQAGEFPHRGLYLMGEPTRPHQGVVIVGDRTDHTLVFEFA